MIWGYNIYDAPICPKRASICPSMPSKYCNNNLLLGSLRLLKNRIGMNKPLYISFCAQKGGVGKSVFTSLLASYLHYRTELSVAVIDCDYPQHSLLKFRAREITKLKTIPKFGKAFADQMASLAKKSYPIIGSDITEGVSAARSLVENCPLTSGFDVIFFDFPGTINTPGMLSALSEMDYLFIPIEADRLVLESEIEFAHTMKELYASMGKSSKLWLYWNKNQRSVKTLLYDNYEKVIKELGLSLLSNRIYHAAAFQKEMEQESEPRNVFRSTVFPYSKLALRGANIPIDEFFDEVIEILNLNMINH